MTNTIFGINTYGLLLNLFFLAIIGSVTVLKSVTIETGADYFLAITKGKWMTLGISNFITILSSEYFLYILLIQLILGMNIYSIIIVSLLAVFFVIMILVPSFISSGHLTVSQLFENKLNKSLGWITKVIHVLFTFIKLALVIFLCGLIFQEILKIDMVSCLLFIIFFTGVCTLVGGLATAVSLQVIQTAGIFLTLAYFSIFGRNIFEINNFLISFRSTFIKTSGVFLNNDISGVIILISLFFLGIWYWGFDQRIFQRTISAGSFNQTLKTHMLGFGVFGLFIFVITNYLFSDTVYSDGNLLMSPQERHMLPFENGILMMGIFSWLMSSLSSTFHSFSSHITFDFYKTFYPKANQQELVLVARLALTVLVLATILLVPLMKLANMSLFIYSFGFFMIFLMPLSSVFIFGFLLNRISIKGVYLSFIFSGLLILIRFSLLILNNHYINNFFVNVDFSYIALFLFFANGFLIILFSFLENKERNPLFADFGQGFINSLNKHEAVAEPKVKELF